MSTAAYQGAEGTTVTCGGTYLKRRLPLHAKVLRGLMLPAEVQNRLLLPAEVPKEETIAACRGAEGTTTACGGEEGTTVVCPGACCLLKCREGPAAVFHDAGGSVVAC